jgi:hypothetical protein
MPRRRPAQAFEGCPPEPAGGPLEPAGNGRPRWMAAPAAVRRRDRTRRTGRLVRHTPGRAHKRAFYLVRCPVLSVVVGRHWPTFDGPVTARTAQKRPHDRVSGPATEGLSALRSLTIGARGRRRPAVRLHVPRAHGCCTPSGGDRQAPPLLSITAPSTCHRPTSARVRAEAAHSSKATSQPCEVCPTHEGGPGRGDTSAGRGLDRRQGGSQWVCQAGVGVGGGFGVKGRSSRGGAHSTSTSLRARATMALV